MTTLTAGTANAELSAGRAESRRRVIGGLLIIYFGIQSAVGLAWDIFWHVAVGRDRFLTPPHVLMYTGVAGGGLVCLYMVLATTWRYRRGVPGVDDTSTTPWLGLFHAPIGFVVAGTGYLALLLAAPLDNYWHILYGIDVTLWAPFHVMGLLGGVIAVVGSMYVFASEINRGRSRGDVPGRFLSLTWLEWALCLVVLGLYRQTLTLALPAFERQHLLATSSPALALHPLIVALGLPLTFAALVRQIGKPVAVVASAALYAIVDVIAEGFARLGTAWLIAADGMSYRPGQPRGGIDLLPDLLLIVSAVMFWLTYRYLMTVRTRRARRWLPYVSGLVAGAGIALADRDWLQAAAGLASAGNILMVTAVATALVGAATAAFGDGFGRALRLTER